MLEMLLDGKNWFPVVTPLTASVALAFVALACRRRVPAMLIIGGAVGVFVGLASRSLWSSDISASTETMEA
jgi:hypothetical protein